MKILLFGKNGQVGWELNRALLPLGQVIALGRDDADFSRPDSLRAIVRENKPDVIVNAAAYTAVDKAEQEEALAFTINAIAVGVIAEEAASLSALFIHYSTDYVFDGTKPGPYTEKDAPKPVNAYGRSKLAGEQAIVSSDCEYVILRTSWIYAARGKNFLKTMLKLAQQQEQLNIVADQYGAPTWARHIADVTAHVLVAEQMRRQAKEFSSAVYHLCNSGKTTWHGFASAIIEYARQLDTTGSIVTNKLSLITTEDYPLPAPRPKNSQMDSASLATRYRLTMPMWNEAMKLCIDEVFTTQ